MSIFRSRLIFMGVKWSNIEKTWVNKRVVAVIKTCLRCIYTTAIHYSPHPPLPYRFLQQATLRAPQHDRSGTPEGEAPTVHEHCEHLPLG